MGLGNGRTYDHLREYGHERMAFIAGNSTYQGSVNRREGFAAAMHDAGLEPLVGECDFSFEKAADWARAHGWQEAVPDWDESNVENEREWVLVSHNRDEIKRVMQNYVGIVRSSLRQERAARRIDMIHRETEEFYQRTRLTSGLCELRNLAAVAHLIVASAQRRTESRGLHTMSDFPDTDPAQANDTVYEATSR